MHVQYVFKRQRVNAEDIADFPDDLRISKPDDINPDHGIPAMDIPYPGGIDSVKFIQPAGSESIRVYCRHRGMRVRDKCSGRGAGGRPPGGCDRARSPGISESPRPLLFHSIPRISGLPVGGDYLKLRLSISPGYIHLSFFSSQYSTKPRTTRPTPTDAKDHGHCSPGIPPTLIPSKPVSRPSGRKIAAITDRT